MRPTAVTLLSGLGLAFCLSTANAAPIAPARAGAAGSAIEQVAGGCGWGFHRHRGYCVRNRHYGHYAYRRAPYGYYRPYPYYGYVYQPWNRPSPTDYEANWLNAREARGYWPY